MPYIHQLPDWPNFRCDMERLAAPLAAVRHKQGLLAGHMGALGFALREEANLETLTADVVKSSAIEGERLDREQVRSSLARRLGLDAGGVLAENRHVEGVVEMMLDATRNFAVPLTEERLFGWHAALFPTGYTGLRRIRTGGWRTAESGPMHVLSGPIGKETVHFQAPDAERLAGEMRAFLRWFNAPVETDPVLKAGMAHLYLVTIHPFEDGNGRIARAITDMALARADGLAERFYSMSSRIEKERSAYYTVLERAQKSGLDVTDWLAWFIDCLDHALDDAKQGLDTVLFKSRVWEKANQFPLNHRQRKVIGKLVEAFEGKLTTAKYAKLTKTSHDTALRDIRELIHFGLLQQGEAGGRSAHYILKKSPEELSGSKKCYKR